MKNFAILKTTRLAAALGLATAVLAGCAGSGTHKVETPNVAHGASKDLVEVYFPDVKDAWLAGGAFIDVEQLRRVGRGMNEDQVRELISYPHFNEGFFHPRVWNYVFNFRTGAGDAFQQCQYQVHYDKNGLSEAFYWRDPSCAAYLQPQAREIIREVPVVAPVVAPVSAPAPERLRIAADALFTFDKSDSGDILAGGRAELDRLVDSIKANYRRVDLVTVIGHTDNLGSDNYNLTLSSLRAATVRDHMVSRGMPNSVVRSFGLGKTQPVKQCDAKLPKNELIACLQPNRRVEIEVIGEKR